jgi:hypothetical protein
MHLFTRTMPFFVYTLNSPLVNILNTLPNSFSLDSSSSAKHCEYTISSRRSVNNLAARVRRSNTNVGRDSKFWMRRRKLRASCTEAAVLRRLVRRYLQRVRVCVCACVCARGVCVCVCVCFSRVRMYVSIYVWETHVLRRCFGAW